jgi:hypothetical protein
VISKEVAEPKELPNFGNGGWGSGFSDGLQFVGSGSNSSLGKFESQIGNSVTAEDTFLKIDL